MPVTLLMSGTTIWLFWLASQNEVWKISDTKSEKQKQGRQCQIPSQVSGCDTGRSTVCCRAILSWSPPCPFSLQESRD